MRRNLIIFSDGTGQHGGARPEQRISNNIYKMYHNFRELPCVVADYPAFRGKALPGHIVAESDGVQVNIGGLFLIQVGRQKRLRVKSHAQSMQSKPQPSSK